MTGEPRGVVAAVGAWPRDAAVVRRAADEAGHRGHSLTVLHVDDRADDDGPDGDRAYDAGRARNGSPVGRAQQLAALAVPGLAVRTVVDPGPVVPSILRAGRAAELLVLGSEGAPPRAKLVRDAVTVNATARARCPVEVVPVPGACPPDPPLSRVVALVTDLDQLEVVLATTFAEARRYGVRVEVVTSSVATGRERSGAASVSEALIPWRHAYPDVPCALVRTPQLAGAATLGLLQPSDLLVAVRGEGASSWGRPDGVIRALVERARCPVLVLPPRSPDRGHRPVPRVT